MYRLLLLFLFMSVNSLWCGYKFEVSFQEGERTHHQVFVFDDKNAAESFKVFYSSLFGSSNRDVQKFSYDYHECQNYLTQHLVSTWTSQEEDGFESLTGLDQDENIDLRSSQLTMDAAQWVVNDPRYFRTFSDFRIVDKIVGVLSSGVLKREKRYQGMPGFERFERDLMSNVAMVSLQNILCAEQSVDEKIARLQREKNLPKDFLCNGREEALKWLLTNDKGHKPHAMHKGLVFRGFNPFAGEKSLVFKEGDVWKIGPTLEGFFEKGLEPLYGRFEDGFEEDMDQDPFGLTGPISMRMSGTESGNSGITSAYGSSCTIKRGIAEQYANKQGSVIFLLDLGTLETAHAVYKTFPTNRLGQVNVEETIPADCIVGVWPTADKGTFIPNPNYQKSEPTVYNIRLPIGKFDIKDVS